MELDLEARIDKRLEEKQAISELKMYRQIDASIKDKFEEARKLFLLFFGGLTLLLTLFGIKTFLDVQDVAKNAAIQQVNKQLVLDDPNSEFRRDVNRVVARSLIAAYLPALIARGRNEFGLREETSISDQDFRRLLEYVSSEDTELRDFTDIVDIMSRADARSSRETLRAQSALRAIAEGAEKKVAWIERHPLKRAAIFRSYKWEDLGSVARQVLEKSESDTTLLQAALEYLRTQEDLSNSEVAGKLLKHRSQDVAEAALLTLARTQPLSRVFADAVDSIRKSKTDRDGVTLIRIVVEVSRSRSRRSIFDEDPEWGKRQELAVSLLNSAIDMGAFFRLSEFGARRERGAGLGLYASIADRKNRFYFIPSALLLGSGKTAIDGIFKGAASDVTKVVRLVKVFCLEFERQCGGAVQISFPKDGAVLTKSGLRLDKSIAPGGVRVRVDEREAANDAHLTWTDKSGIAQSAILGSIENAPQLVFSVVSNRKLKQDHDED